MDGTCASGAWKEAVITSAVCWLKDPLANARGEDKEVMQAAG
jgi:hypothetical protein